MVARLLIARAGRLHNYAGLARDTPEGDAMYSVSYELERMGKACVDLEEHIRHELEEYRQRHVRIQSRTRDTGPEIHDTVYLATPARKRLPAAPTRPQGGFRLTADGGY